MTARAVALAALGRIEDDGAYANITLRGALARSSLDERDRRFVTELVYGTTRMRRACDYLVDRFLMKPVTDDVRRVLRLGAYQLHYTNVPPHAAVGETVALAPRRVRGLVNAVLRRVAGTAVDWPDDPTRLSYPEWIVDRLVADLGDASAVAALEQMNEAASMTIRDDGYVQDRASQWVAAHVDAKPDDLVLDMCAAPGGKASAMEATVVACDVRGSRASLMKENGIERVVVADGRAAPFADAVFGRVLVDAPCSGLGALRRRPDARWRIRPTDVDELAGLQRSLVDAAVALLEPGGVLVYSVCTLTKAESLEIDQYLAERHPHLVPLPFVGEPWQPWGRGAILLPQTEGTDGMTLLRLTNG